MTLRRSTRDRLPPSADRPRGRAARRFGPGRARIARRWSSAALAGALLAVACGSGTPRSLPTPLTSEQIRERADQPLTLLGPCEITPTPADIGEVDGLLLPPQAVTVERTDTEGLVNLRGYVPMTPVQVRLWYEDTAAAQDFELLSAEDETQEAEVLVDVGDHRLYVKAAAVCELGSVFVVVVAPSASADAVPVPSGSPAG